MDIEAELKKMEAQMPDSGESSEDGMDINWTLGIISISCMVKVAAIYFVYMACEKTSDTVRRYFLLTIVGACMLFVIWVYWVHIMTVILAFGLWCFLVYAMIFTRRSCKEFKDSDKDSDHADHKRNSNIAIVVSFVVDVIGVGILYTMYTGETKIKLKRYKKKKNEEEE